MYLNDSGFEASHIMFMSNHKNESYLRSYNRSFSSNQKKFFEQYTIMHGIRISSWWKQSFNAYSWVILSRYQEKLIWHQMLWTLPTKHRQKVQTRDFSVTVLRNKMVDFGPDNDVVYYAYANNIWFTLIFC